MAYEDKKVLRVRRSAATGNPDTAIYNMFYGPNHTGSGDLVAPNQDFAGYVFITKPNLNLKPSNIGHVRKLQYLLDDDPNSNACAVKCCLTSSKYWNYAKDGRRSNAINDRYPFIAFLSSSLESISGWPDEVMEFYESEPGIAGEVHGWADGRPESYSTFDLQLTFNSKEGDPHNSLFSTLHQYMGRVGTGEIYPLRESEVEWEVDYNMNVYVILMDRNKKFVQKIASLGGGGIISGAPTGASFNLDHSIGMQTASKQISVPMKCFGFRYNDPAIFENFNNTVGMVNSDMARVMAGIDDGSMVRITEDVKFMFNFKGYPFINPETSELEWWIERNVYDDIIESYEAI